MIQTYFKRKQLYMYNCNSGTSENFVLNVDGRKCCYSQKYQTTVKPRFTDTRLIRTPRYYGQFRWSRRKPYTFSLKLIRLIRTLVNTDNGHFSVSRVTNCYTLSTPLYGHCLSVHCQFSWLRLFANFTLVK